MYAVIKTGGKQYKVAQGDTLRVEKLSADVGANIDFNNVLLVADNDNIKIGTPQVPGGKVLATVQEHGRGKKKSKSSNLNAANTTVNEWDIVSLLLM